MSSYAIDGERLEAIRVSQRMSPATLADLVGCTPGYIRLLERNVKNPSLEMVGKLERALGVTAEALGCSDLPPRATDPERQAEAETPAAVSVD